MFCPNCGTEIKEGSKFCGSCGANVDTEYIEETEVGKRFCLECGNELREEEKFCSSCGARISEPGMEKASTGTRFGSYSLGDAANDMQINKWKIFGYTVVTWFLFSILARIISEIPSPSGGYIPIVSCQGAVWGWMSLFMGIYLSTKLKKGIEAVWGVVLFFICTLPVIGMFIGIGYFARAYVELEKARWGEGVDDAQSTLDKFTAEVTQSKEEEQKAREVTEHGDEEKAAGYPLFLIQK